VRISPKLLLFEILAFVVFAVLAASGYVAFRLSQGPINLELIRPQVERSLSDARGGQPVKIKSLVLEWEGKRGRVEAAARGMTALDKSGKVVFSAERAAIALDAGALLTGKIKTRQMRLENGQAAVVRSKEGVWTLANVVLLKEPPRDKPFDPLKDLDWTTLATPVRALISAGSFERVELVNFNLAVDDQKSGTRWGANPVGGVWSATREGITLDLDLKLVGASEPNRVQIALAADGEVTRAAGALTLEGVDPLTIGEMLGYTGQEFSSGLPANATFKVEASEKGGLQSTRLQLSNVAGRGKFAGVDVSIASLAFDAVYDPATKKITLESLKVASDKATGDFSGTADISALMAGNPDAAIPFQVSGRNFDLGITPMFETAWPFSSADITGVMEAGKSKVTIKDLKAKTGELVVAASGEVWLDGPPEKRLLGVKVKATGDGVITPQQVVSFWPVNLGSGGRTWVRDHVPSGKAGKVVFSVDWPPGANDRGYLDNSVMTLDWEVTDAAVKFLPDFPAVTNIVGKGRLEGNKLSMELTSGALGAWIVDEGKVDFPQFAPKGAMMDIVAMGHGDLKSAMRVLDASNLKVGSKYGLKIDEMAGTGGATVHIQRPMADVPDDALTYTITGGFRGAGAPDLAFGFGLTAADARFEVTRDSMAISGAGQFGPAPVVFDWKERFDLPGKPPGGAELTASAKAGPDLLNAFGFAARNVMQGEAAVEVRATGPGGNAFSEIAANADFTHAALDIPEFGWRKKYEAPAQGSFRYGKDDKGAVLTGDIRADGLELTGEARMDLQSQLVSADIERIFSRDSVDLHGGVTRLADGGYKIAVSGPYFDASPWMDSFLQFSGDKQPTADEQPGPKGGPEGAVFDLQLAADKLKLRPNAEMANAKVSLQFDDAGPRTGVIGGEISKGKRADVTIKSNGDKRNVSIKADDAGFAAIVLLKLDYLRGGKMTLDGVFGSTGGDANIVITDVRLKDAPLVAQLLSIASLRGLADVLNGDGVLFSKIDAPVKLRNGRIDLPGLSARGPAMGLTARGWIAPKAGELSLDGVLVPSFGVNSVLGGIPIIGDLFVSRQGEGVFAPTYQVRGTFEKAHISINPIAAITPGFLRRIFENPSEAPPMADATPAPKPAAPAPARN
jgi:uncharacterized protein involved in outer membrane biogenesis